MHKHIVDDSWYALSVWVWWAVGGGGGEAGSSSFEIVKRGISYIFLWTGKGLALLDRCRTEMPGLQVQKMVLKSRTSFYEYPFNNTAHCHVLKLYYFSC